MKKTLSFILSALMTAQLAVISPVNAVETVGTPVSSAIVSKESTDTFSFDFYLKTVDSDDGSLIPGVDMKLVEYEAFNDKTLFPIENEKYALRTLAEWNTSDVNPFIVHLDDLDVNHYYVVQCDKLPEGYFSGTLHNSYFIAVRSGSELKSFMEGGNQEFNKGIYQIRLNKGQPYEDWSFPKTVTADFTFGYYDRMDIQKDRASAEIIPDLEVEVVSVTKDENKYNVGDKIGTFNTSDGEIRFTKDVFLENIDDCVCFGLKINNLPDKYAAHMKEFLRSDSVDNYKVAYFSAINTVLGNTNSDFVLVPGGAPDFLGTTTGTTATVTTTNQNTDVLIRVGDANCDDQINMADAVMIMQSIADPDKYKLTEQGEKNADVDGSGDVTNNDALKIQRFKLRIINSLE